MKLHFEYIAKMYKAVKTLFYTNKIAQTIADAAKSLIDLLF